MISVYLTCKDLTEAKKITRHLLKSKLIKCANMFPIKSMFEWKKEITQKNEVAVLCKAKRENFKKIEGSIKKLHSYELPCIVAFDWAESNRDYANWVRN